MAGFIAQAMSALMSENAGIVRSARVIGGVAACRLHRREEAVDIPTGRRVYRWQIEFETEEDMAAFDNAVRAIVDEVAGGGE